MFFSEKTTYENYGNFFHFSYLDDRHVVFKERLQSGLCLNSDVLKFTKQTVSEIKRKKNDKTTRFLSFSRSIALSGKDMGGIAQTASGKTCTLFQHKLVQIKNMISSPKKISTTALVPYPTGVCQNKHF